MAANPTKTEYEIALEQIGTVDLNKDTNDPKLESKLEQKYDADSESSGKKRIFRERLILGEADFSYTKALIKKHENALPELPKFITATELRDKETLEAKYEDFQENIAYIQSKGGATFVGVDAKNIQNAFPNKRFERIHFNAPYIKDKEATADTRNLVSGFFASASKVQNEADRVHISLVDKIDRKGGRYFWHGATYDIIEASAQAGYKLLKKRKFDNTRYVGYIHKETDKNEPSPNAQYIKEFVFEKTTLTPDEIKAEYLKLGILFSSTESRGLRAFFDKNEDHNPTPYDTADESSDYFTEESSTPIPKMGI